MSADTAPAAGTTVEWNPVIEAVWWAKEMAAVRVALGAQFPDAAATVIDTAVETAVARVAVGARIPNYLPVLVGREARVWLAHHLREA